MTSTVHKRHRKGPSYLAGNEKVFAFDSSILNFGLDGGTDFGFVAVSASTVDVTVATSNGDLYSLRHLPRLGLSRKKTYIYISLIFPLV